MRTGSVWHSNVEHCHTCKFRAHTYIHINIYSLIHAITANVPGSFRTRLYQFYNSEKIKETCIVHVVYYGNSVSADNENPPHMSLTQQLWPSEREKIIFKYNFTQHDNILDTINNNHEKCKRRKLDTHNGKRSYTKLKLWAVFNKLIWFGMDHNFMKITSDMERRR